MFSAASRADGPVSNLPDKREGVSTRKRQTGNNNQTQKESVELQIDVDENGQQYVVHNDKTRDKRITTAQRKDGKKLLGAFYHHPLNYTSDLDTTQSKTNSINGMTLSEAVECGKDGIVHPCPVIKLHKSSPESTVSLSVYQPRIENDNPAKIPTGKLLEKLFNGPSQEWYEDIDLRTYSMKDHVAAGVNSIIPYVINVHVEDFESNFNCELLLEAPSEIQLPDDKSVFHKKKQYQSWSDIKGGLLERTNTGEKKHRDLYIVLTNKHDKKLEAFVAPESYNNAEYQRWLAIPPETIFSELQKASESRDEVTVNTVSVTLNNGKKNQGGHKTIPIYKIPNPKDTPDSNPFVTWFLTENRDQIIKQDLSEMGVSNESNNSDSDPAFGIDYFMTSQIDENGDKFMPVPKRLFEYYLAEAMEKYYLNRIIMPIDHLRVVVRPISPQDLVNEIRKDMPVMPTFFITLTMSYDLYNLNHMNIKEDEQMKELNRGAAMKHFAQIYEAGKPISIEDLQIDVKKRNR